MTNQLNNLINSAVANTKLAVYQNLVDEGMNPDEAWGLAIWDNGTESAYDDAEEFVTV